MIVEGSSLFMGGYAYKMQYLIVIKLTEAGAFSAKTAVTPEEANLTIPECRWLSYLTGGISSRIRKTERGRYYIRPRTLFNLKAILVPKYEPKMT